MVRPNLAGRPFLDTRPVLVVGAVLALLAAGLTAMSVADYLSERGEESHLADTVRDLETRRAELAFEVTALDRELARAPWKKLKAETASMQQLVVQRGSLWSTLFAALERVLPWDTRLLIVNPRTDENGQINIALSGVATDRAAWLKLLGRLFTDTHFSDPLPRTEESPGEQNAVGFKFTLDVRYWPEGRP